jgi:hypothetical protein
MASAAADQDDAPRTPATSTVFSSDRDHQHAGTAIVS